MITKVVKVDNLLKPSDYVNPTLHGPFVWPPDMGGHYGPPIFSRKLYIVWSFGVDIHVYNHNPCLHANFQTSLIFPLRRYDVIFGQNDVILAKIGSKNKEGHSLCKNDRVNLKIGQYTSFDA